MGGYVVRLVKKAGLRQRFHVRIESTNGQVIFTSEKYRDHSYAWKLGREFAEYLGGVFVDEVDEAA